MACFCVRHKQTTKAAMHAWPQRFCHVEKTLLCDSPPWCLDLKVFCSLFHSVLWALGKEVRYRCLICTWVLRCYSVTELWPVMCLCITTIPSREKFLWWQPRAVCLSWYVFRRNDLMSIEENNSSRFYSTAYDSLTMCSWPDTKWKFHSVEQALKN